MVNLEGNIKRFSVKKPPTNLADFIPYATATLQQLWVVCGGRFSNGFSSARIYGPEPIILTPTIIANEGAKEIKLKTQVPASYTWINQEQLINGQEAIWFPPLTQ